MTILYLEQGGLGMGNRDYYIDEQNAEIKAAYRDYLRKIFTLAGVEGDVEVMVNDVLAVEDAIAAKHWSNVECRDIQKGYNPYTFEQVADEYNAVDWKAYFAAMGVENIEKLVVSQPSSFANIMEVIATTPIEVTLSSSVLDA